MKILVIRFSSIGDIVLTSPVVRCLKKQLQHAEIHFLTKKTFKGLVENNPHIDKVYSIEKQVNEVMGQLKAEQYDYIIDLHHNLRTMHVKMSLQKKSFSLRKLNFQKWMMVNFKVNLLPPVHIVDRYFETVKSLNVNNDGLGLDYFIPPGQEVDLQSLPASHQNGYVGIVIGAKHFTKRLPVDKYIEVCNRLDYPVVLLGGIEDAERGEVIVTAVGHRIYNACGKYSLDQSASLVKQAKLIITNDTGLMHIAAAFKKKIISTWGNTIPEFGMTPYYGKFEMQNSKFEIKDLYCRPCSKIGFEKCPKGHFRCMMDIPSADIYSSASEMLKN